MDEYRRRALEEMNQGRTKALEKRAERLERDLRILQRANLDLCERVARLEQWVEHSSTMGHAAPLQTEVQNEVPEALERLERAEELGEDCEVEVTAATLRAMLEKMDGEECS